MLILYYSSTTRYYYNTTFTTHVVYRRRGALRTYWRRRRRRRRRTRIYTGRRRLDGMSTGRRHLGLCCNLIPVPPEHDCVAPAFDTQCLLTVLVCSFIPFGLIYFSLPRTPSLPFPRLQLPSVDPSSSRRRRSTGRWVDR